MLSTGNLFDSQFWFWILKETSCEWLWVNYLGCGLSTLWISVASPIKRFILFSIVRNWMWISCHNIRDPHWQLDDRLSHIFGANSTQSSLIVASKWKNVARGGERQGVHSSARDLVDTMQWKIWCKSENDWLSGYLYEPIICFSNT